ncbi:MAG: HTTM domain-containing protein [Cytophagaceae bacterium]|nr:HTTM domain-containing protein [Cytophagaceae bacterium]MDW8456769.1 HTTM domain-containing protein [Cytophagaceae bacterium]
MNKHTAYALAFVLTVVSVILFMLQPFLISEVVVKAYEGKSSSFITNLIDLIYPRFEYEKNRLGIDFFINKSSQILRRMSALFLFISLITFSYYRFDVFRKFLRDHLYVELVHKRVDVLRKILYTFFLFVASDLTHSLLMRTHVSAFYQPVLLLRIMGIPFPSAGLIGLLSFTLFVSIICVLFNYRAVLFSAISIILFVIMEGLHTSFGKTDHGYTTFMYVLMMFPFLLNESKTKKNDASAWPLLLMRVSICLVYLMSGLEKLTNSGTYWLDHLNFKTLLLLHPTDVGLWIADSVFLCSILAIGGIAFQLCFWLILFVPLRLKYFFLITAVMFHYGNVILLDIGSFINAWVISLSVFVDWEKLRFPVVKRY